MKNLLIVIIAMIMGGCYSAQYNVRIKDVVRQQKTIDMNGEQQIVHLSKSVSKFEDDMISIEWTYDQTNMVFKLTNKSNTENLKIIWNDVTFVSVDNESKKIIHGGVKYVEKNNFCTPSVIVYNSIINDMILPTNNIVLSKTTWKELPIFPKDLIAIGDLEKYISTYKNKQFKILMPLQMGDIIHEYLFIFTIRDIWKEQN